MIPELQGYALLYRTTHALFHKALEGLTPEQALERRDGANPILWIAAHVVVVRASFSNGIGAPVDVPWGKPFARGAEVKDVTAWPSLDEVRAKWDEVHAAFAAQLETLASAQVTAATAAPGLDGTLLGTLGLAAIHDAYHVGQLGAARRLHGLDRLVG
jgi:uncharacterized damage-inducible protein DinB